MDFNVIALKERLEGYFLLDRLILENKTYPNLEIYRNIIRRGCHGLALDYLVRASSQDLGMPYLLIVHSHWLTYVYNLGSPSRPPFFLFPFFLIFNYLLIMSILFVCQAREIHVRNT